MQIQAQSEQAKADKDVIRLNCLLDKLTQAKVNGNMMDQAMQALQESVSRCAEKKTRFRIVIDSAAGFVK
jgi:hypothetical protein